MNFGHFIDYSTWKEAVDLLNFQIEHKKTNKSYNNLNFQYFSKISKKVKSVRTKAYYTSRVQNSLFYGLENEFFFEHHTVPKAGMGLRKYFFFSYPMQCLYYSIGVYLLKVSYQFKVDSKSPNIFSYYGGDIQWTNEKLVYNKKSIYYRHYHNLFKRKVTELSDEKEANRILVQLDIQNYFDELSISNLLRLINNYAKPSELKKYQYDELTQELIQFFFMYLHGNNLPQSSNNIFSGYIGYLYMIFGDHIVEDVVNSVRFDKHIEEYKIVRYVDDIYLSLDLPKDEKSNSLLSEKDENKLIFDLLHELSDQFYYKLGLRFNSKTNIYRTRKEEDRAALRKSVNKDYQFLDVDALRKLINKVKNENKTKGQKGKPKTATKQKEKISKIVEDALPVPKKTSLMFEGIEALSKLSSIDLFTSKHEEINDKLKYAYDEGVNNYLAKPDILSKLNQLLSGIEAVHLKVATKPLMSLFLRSDEASKRLKKIIENIDLLNTYNMEILLTYLSLTDFKSRKVFEKLQESIHYQSIIEKFSDSNPVNNKFPGYYNLSIDQLKPLIDQFSFVEQVRLRSYNEKLENYSISLNHLLNELHFVCCFLEKEDIKKYDANRVDDFLHKQHLENSTRIKIRNLFDRRNNNAVSHPGDSERIAWGVNENEYYMYKEIVSEVLKKIL